MAYCRNFAEHAGLPQGLRSISRRQALRAGSLGLLGLGLPDLLSCKSPAQASTSGSFGRAKACILLFMWGGPAQQDTWDPKPGAPAEFRGDFSPISTKVPGIHICEHFPLLAQRTDKLAIVRSMTHGNVDHTSSTSYLLTGHPPLPAGGRRNDWPHIGAVLANLGRGQGPLPPFVNMRPTMPGDVPRFVEQSHGQSAGWLGSTFDPLTIDSNPNEIDYKVGDFAPQPPLTAQDIRRREAFIEQLDGLGPLSANPTAQAMKHHYARAFDLIDSAVGQDAFDLTKEDLKTRQTYGLHPHGQAVLQARRLVERGVPLTTVFWQNDGVKNVSVYWDTHSKNFIDLKNRLMPPADQAFLALLDDLENRGMLDETLVIWTGEFGRTPRVGQRNSDAGAGRDGRDHWPGCFTTVLAGGGIRGGMVHGQSDRFAAYPASKPTNPADLIATAYHLLGVPPNLVRHDMQGRPHVICPGKPIFDLIG